MYGVSVSRIGDEKFLVSAVTGDSAGHYFDVASWQIYGSIGVWILSRRCQWLTDDTPRENRATESTTLNNGDVVVAYWGYSNVANTQTNLNAQIVRADGTISEPIIIGTAGFTHSHQPFAIGDDSWGIAWDGNEIGGSEGTNVAIFNNDGEKMAHTLMLKIIT